jgi:hypothetical protein
MQRIDHSRSSVSTVYKPKMNKRRQDNDNSKEGIKQDVEAATHAFVFVAPSSRSIFYQYGDSHTHQRFFFFFCQQKQASMHAYISRKKPKHTHTG